MDNQIVRKLVSKIRQLSDGVAGARCKNCVSWGLSRSGDYGEWSVCVDVTAVRMRLNCFGNSTHADFGCRFYKPKDKDRLCESGFVKDDARF